MQKFEPEFRGLHASCCFRRSSSLLEISVAQTGPPALDYFAATPPSLRLLHINTATSIVYSTQRRRWHRPLRPLARHRGQPRLACSSSRALSRSTRRYLVPTQIVVRRWNTCRRHRNRLLRLLPQTTHSRSLAFNAARGLNRRMLARLFAMRKRQEEQKEGVVRVRLDLKGRRGE